MDPNDHFHIPPIREGYAVSVRPVRWTPYKPGAQTKRKGRWQEMNDHGGWSNCKEAPVVIEADHHVFNAAPDMRDALKAAQRILAILTSPEQKGNSQALYAQCREIELMARKAIEKAENAQ